ncbi:efflux RND transporter periplasmic adaptor subunit [Aquimarina sp. W85]|uniref:efflux RND transporter periplasmic adaptor subunit n=1 Tax=Aquimarina rhodophyticola TaxID=3342246 RepID=UPI00366FCE95
MDKRVIYIIVGILFGLVSGYLFFGSQKGLYSTSDAQNNQVNVQETLVWTCSMHPQIKQSESGECPICGMDLIPAEIGTEGLLPNQFKLTANAIALANIQTQKIESIRSDKNTLVLSGTIMQNKEKTVVQTAYYSGRLEKLNINYEGETIRSGQLLARIYSPDLIAAQQELLTMATLKESQPDLYNAVRSKLLLWKLSNNQVDAIEASGVIQNTIPIYARSTGVVTSKMVEVGDYVKEGQPLLQMVDLSTVWATFDVYESDITQIKKGQEISIRTKNSSHEIKTTISFIDPMLDSNTRVVAVRAMVQNIENQLKPGMFVEGLVKLDSNPSSFNQFTIPKSAVLWTGERSVVYVKIAGDQPIFELREIRLGTSYNDSYTVLEGLLGAEEIVVNGAFTVDASAQLQGKKSMMQVQKVSQDNPIHQTPMDIPSALEQEVEQILLTYSRLKDAFVVADTVKIEVFSKELIALTTKIDDFNLANILASHIAEIKKMALAIVKDKTFNNQRDSFGVLSEKIIDIAKNLSATKETFYIMTCPMANSNKGANWLSREEKIENPYFGNEMLGCGSIIDTISVQ